MPDLRGDRTSVKLLLWSLFLPLDESDWIRRVVLACLVTVQVRHHHSVVPQRADVEYALLQILLIIKDDSVLLNPHVAAVGRHNLEHIEPLFVPFGLTLHPQRGHHWGLAHVGRLPLLEGVLSVHRLGVHGQPAIDPRYHRERLFTFDGWLLDDVKVVL